MKITPRRYRLAWTALGAITGTAIIGTTLLFSNRVLGLSVAVAGLSVLIADITALIILYSITRRWP